MTHIVCGVDVSAETLDARIGRNGVWQEFARTTEGIARLARFCKSRQVSLLVMEATGGYERLPLVELWVADVPVALVNPRSVRQFAQAMGALEKTDKIDAGMIVWYAETKRIVPTPPVSDTQQRLTALVLRMRQLTELRTAQNNQRRLVQDPDALASFSAIVATINQQIRVLEAKLTALIDADPLWLALDTAFREIKGVADRTVARLLANLPRSAPSRARQWPNSPASPRSPTIAANEPASARCAADAKRCDPSFTRSPNWSAATNRTSRRSMRGCVRPASRPTSCVSRWPTSCWCG